MAYKDPEDQKRYDRKRYAANKRWLAEYKLRVGCSDCGYKAHPAPLQFDHVQPYLHARSVSMLSGTARWKIEEEIERCEVVCANCHSIRTSDRGQLATKGVPLTFEELAIQASAGAGSS